MCGFPNQKANNFISSGQINVRIKKRLHLIWFRSPDRDHLSMQYLLLPDEGKSNFDQLTLLECRGKIDLGVVGVVKRMNQINTASRKKVPRKSKTTEDKGPV